LNRYVEEQKPWELAKDEARAQELDRVLYELADGLVAVALAVAPYLPEAAPRILAALRQPQGLAFERIRPGSAEAVEGIDPAAPLFPRIELPTAAA
jgi:methionyl-tRNA synthetase